MLNKFLFVVVALVIVNVQNAHAQNDSWAENWNFRSQLRSGNNPIAAGFGEVVTVNSGTNDTGRMRIDGNIAFDPECTVNCEDRRASAEMQLNQWGWADSVTSSTGSGFAETESFTTMDMMSEGGFSVIFSQD